MAGRPQGPESSVAGPGPGSYDPAVPGSAGPAFTMASRLASAWEARVDVPAVGSYDPGRFGGTGGPAYTMGSRGGTGPSGRPEAPPVGWYDPPASGSQGPAFTLGQRRPGPSERDEVPPVGSYESELPWAPGPAFTHGVRHPTAEEDKPSGRRPVGRVVPQGSAEVLVRAKACSEDLGIASRF